MHTHEQDSIVSAQRRVDYDTRGTRISRTRGLLSPLLFMHIYTATMSPPATKKVTWSWAKQGE